ncbi:MAG: acetyl-CoA carboxylase, carboxyltransferase subunit beta [Sulfurospirillaceae bacterium]|nr:acetyl-CoA carboxylase, carboxyltransferase subunit beta [Sulfurospirillaceae bacterium]
MKFSEIFGNFRKTQPSKDEAPQHWVKCKQCQSLMYYKEVENQLNVCPKCGFHFRINIQKRIEQLIDADTFDEFDSNLAPVDPLKFVDKKSYKKRIQEAQNKTNRTSSVISGSGKINGIPLELVVFDFDFMGGSLGSVEGEKIVRAAKRAIKKQHGLVIVSASGGARMQESTFSLLQMSKTSAAIKELANHKLPYISILTDPTMGGVSASFAWLGDIIIAEPGALVGFAGQRVIKQTIGAELPEGFQRSEFLIEHGLIDMIVKRSELKKTISDILIFFQSDKKDFELKIKGPSNEDQHIFNREDKE